MVDPERSGGFRVSGIGKGDLFHIPSALEVGPLIEVSSLAAGTFPTDTEVVVEVTAEDVAAKNWSEKYASDNVPAPICPRCKGPCAGAIAGLWCVSCGLRAYA